jgi:hypothetical protein
VGTKAKPLVTHLAGGFAVPTCVKQCKAGTTPALAAFMCGGLICTSLISAEIVARLTPRLVVPKMIGRGGATSSASTRKVSGPSFLPDFVDGWVDRCSYWVLAQSASIAIPTATRRALKLE